MKYFLFKKDLYKIVFYFSSKKRHETCHDCQANAASDWLTLAALKCFTEWVGHCAKEGSAHMAQACHGQPSRYIRCSPERASPIKAIFERVHVG